MCTSKTKGFESFITKGSPLHDVSEDMPMICHNKECEKMFYHSYVCNCDCKFIFYCSEECWKQDSDHQCDSENAGGRMVEREVVQARLIIGSQKFDKDVLYTGVKKGNKYVRGVFVMMLPPTKYLPDGPCVRYGGEVATVKINGVVSVIAHGRGFILTNYLRHVGTFDMGKRSGAGSMYNTSGLYLEAEWKDNAITGIHKYTRDGYEAFGWTQETCMKVTCTSRDIHDSWKKTEYSVCLEKNGPFGEFIPITIRKTELLTRFDHSRVVDIEKVGKINFKRTVHWTGENGPTGYCTDGPLISFSSNNSCSAHGKWHYGSICPNITTFQGEEVVPECTCQMSKKITEGGFVMSKPPPTHVSKVKRCRGGRSNTSLKKPHVARNTKNTKDAKIRGVSYRDMNRDIDGISDDLGMALREGGWVLKSQKNHFKFSRVVDGTKQNFVCSKTPSVRRTRKNELSVMKNLSRMT